MQVTIDKDILEPLDFLNISKDKKELLINILLIKGIEVTVLNEEFLASEMTKKMQNLKL